MKAGSIKNENFQYDQNKKRSSAEHDGGFLSGKQVYPDFEQNKQKDINAGIQHISLR